MYVQIVFDQSVSTFIDCHKKAFKFFGGVPNIVKIDNLKAGILEVDFYEPTVQRNYAAFAAHYGFMAEPCRVYTPLIKVRLKPMLNTLRTTALKAGSLMMSLKQKIFLLIGLTILPM
jgi:transposase